MWLRPTQTFGLLHAQVGKPQRSNTLLLRLYTSICRDLLQDTEYDVSFDDENDAQPNEALLLKLTGKLQKAFLKKAIPNNHRTKAAFDELEYFVEQIIDRAAGPMEDQPLARSFFQICSFLQKKPALRSKEQSFQFRKCKKYFELSPDERKMFTDRGSMLSSLMSSANKLIDPSNGYSPTIEDLPFNAAVDKFCEQVKRETMLYQLSLFAAKLLGSAKSEGYITFRGITALPYLAITDKTATPVLDRVTAKGQMAAMFKARAEYMEDGFFDAFDTEAKNGSNKAAELLGHYYLYVNKACANGEKAIFYLTMAMNRGSSKAAKLLMSSLLYGAGSIEIDKQRAQALKPDKLEFCMLVPGEELMGELVTELSELHTGYTPSAHGLFYQRDFYKHRLNFLTLDLGFGGVP